MAISKAMRAALRAISYLDINVKKTYRLRRALGNLGSTLYAQPPEYKIWDHSVVYEGHSVPVRIFSPPDGPEDSALVFFHGGGWVTGNIDTYGRVCVELAAQTRRTVISVDYRLAPEYRFPAAIEDCYAVVREILVHSASEFRSDRITLIGDSAGGNLAAAVSLMARDRGEFAVPAQILVYPSTYHDHSSGSLFRSVTENGTDFLLTSKMVDDYLQLYMSGPEDLKNPYFSPLSALDLSRQPRTLIISAEFCPLRDEGEYYGEMLYRAGNDVTVRRIADGLHGFLSLPVRYAPVRDAYEAINAFLREGSG